MCKTRKKTGLVGCCDNSIAIRFDVLEGIILKEINKQIDKYYNQIRFEKSYYEKKVNSSCEKDKKTLEKEKVILGKKIREYKNRFALLYEDRVNKIITSDEFIILKEKYNDEITNFTIRANEINEEIASLNKKNTQKKQEQHMFEEYIHLEKLDRLAIETFISKIIIGKVNAKTKQRPMKIIWNFFCS